MVDTWNLHNVITSVSSFKKKSKSESHVSTLWVLILACLFPSALQWK